MTWLPRSQFQAIVRKVKERKEKRAAKALTLWPVKRKKPQRHSEWRQWRDKCDRLASMRVLLHNKKVNNGMCQVCARNPAQCAYHVFSRGHYSVRWDLTNLLAACNPCNWAEKMNRQDYRAKHIFILGPEVHDALEAKSRLSGKVSVPDLKAKAEELRRQIVEVGK